MKQMNKVGIKDLRYFGFIVGGLFLCIGIFPVLFKGQPFNRLAVSLSIILLMPSFLYPKLLYWPYRGWMLLGTALGWVNTRVILGLVFYFIVMPMAIIMRLFGYDPLAMSFEINSKTYRKDIKVRDSKHVQYQY